MTLMTTKVHEGTCAIPLIASIQGIMHSGQMKGFYKIKVNVDNVSQTQAKIEYLGSRSICSVQWEFPILSKAKFFKLVSTSAQDFKIHISRENESFNVSISAEKLDREAKKIVQKMNVEIFTRNSSRLNFFVNWCKENANKKERQQFLLSCIFSFSKKQRLCALGS